MHRDPLIIVQFTSIVHMLWATFHMIISIHLIDCRNEATGTFSISFTRVTILNGLHAAIEAGKSLEVLHGHIGLEVC